AARAQAPATARQTVPLLAGSGGWMQRPLASQVSAVQTVPSSAHAVPLAAGAPPHRPTWQLSATVQSLPSSQAVPSATGVAVHVPPAQVSLLVQVFPSSHTAPSSRVGSPTQVPSWQASFPVQKFPSSHTAPFGWGASGGQVALAPVHVSAASHAPAAGRHSTLLGWK